MGFAVLLSQILALSACYMIWELTSSWRWRHVGFAPRLGHMVGIVAIYALVSVRLLEILAGIVPATL